MQNEKKFVAVYWDFENIHKGVSNDLKHRGLIDITSMIEYISTLGEICINKAYANWVDMGLDRYRYATMEHSVDLIQIFARVMQSGEISKNGADIRMAIDVIEDIFTMPRIDTVVIISGDSDFTSLAQMVRKHGRYVVGIGAQNATSQFWIKSVNEFKFYHNIVLQETNTPTSRKYRDVAIEKAKKHVVQAIKRLTRGSMDGKVERVALKPIMLRLDPTFDESSLGFNSFTKFLEFCKDIVTLSEGKSDLMVEIRDDIDMQRYGGRSDSRDHRGSDRAPRRRDDDRRFDDRKSDDRRSDDRNSDDRNSDDRKFDRRRDEKADDHDQGANEKTEFTRPMAEAKDLVRKAMVAAEEKADGKRVLSTHLKRQLQAIEEDFDYKAFGYFRFLDFLKACSDVIDLQRSGRGYTVSMAEGGGDALATAEPAEEAKAEASTADEAPKAEVETTIEERGHMSVAPSNGSTRRRGAGRGRLRSRTARALASQEDAPETASPDMNQPETAPVQEAASATPTRGEQADEQVDQQATEGRRTSRRRRPRATAPSEAPKPAIEERPKLEEPTEGSVDEYRELLQKLNYDLLPMEQRQVALLAAWDVLKDHEKIKASTFDKNLDAQLKEKGQDDVSSKYIRKVLEKAWVFEPTAATDVQLRSTVDKPEDLFQAVDRSVIQRLSMVIDEPHPTHIAGLLYQKTPEFAEYIKTLMPEKETATAQPPR